MAAKILWMVTAEMAIVRLRVVSIRGLAVVSLVVRRRGLPILRRDEVMLTRRVRDSPKLILKPLLQWMIIRRRLLLQVLLLIRLLMVADLRRPSVGML